jgi:hypothetical protein
MNLFAHIVQLYWPRVRIPDETSTFRQESISRRRIANGASERVVLYLTKETCANLVGRAP